MHAEVSHGGGGSALGNGDAKEIAVMQREFEKLGEELRTVKGQLEASRVRERALEEQVAELRAPTKTIHLPSADGNARSDPSRIEATDSSSKEPHRDGVSSPGPDRPSRSQVPTTNNNTGINVAWVNLFEQLDVNGNQSLGVGELQRALEADG
eukprot:2774550-Rhodomonas_salina.1